MLQFAATLLLLSVVCVSSPELPPGEQAKQWQWLAYSGIVYAICILLSLLFYPYLMKFKWPDYTHIVVWSLILLGGCEAVTGLRQLYGFTYSNHSLFALTGSFFNPGPYSGYLAMIFPVCLSEYYRLKEISKTSFWAKIGYYFTIGILLLMLCVLPAGMSRSSWFAAGISGLFVIGYYKQWGKKLKEHWINNRKKALVWLVSGCICLLIGLVAIFYLKKDSANGRLFMWKISLNAIAEKPLTGYGYDGFSTAYGAAQEAYFANGTYAVWEEHVAGSPEYAFNEFLQIAIEWGVPALLFCLTVVGFCFWHGLKKSRIGVCGGILSLAVFAFSSYPLQLSVFIVTFFILLLACITGKNYMWLIVSCLIVFSCSLHLWKTDDYDACKEWTHARLFYNSGAYESARDKYILLYSKLKNRAMFMFEYGRCLQKLNDYDASNRVLQETGLLTCDPMVFNLIGKNYQNKGEYEKAEEYFLRSVHRLPGRIYPYYLLAKLYAEPDFFQVDKLEYAARMVMEKEPKVQSTAIREMREEVRKICSTHHSSDQK
ncbi:hypothetical protein D0T87_06625 [Bacteroides sp. 51]|nr:hypothetical protein [Bacteroides sp. 51]